MGAKALAKLWHSQVAFWRGPPTGNLPLHNWEFVQLFYLKTPVSNNTWSKELNGTGFYLRTPVHNKDINLQCLWDVFDDLWGDQVQQQDGDAVHPSLAPAAEPADDEPSHRHAEVEDALNASSAHASIEPEVGTTAEPSEADGALSEHVNGPGLDEESQLLDGADASQADDTSGDLLGDGGDPSARNEQSIPHPSSSDAPSSTHAPSSRAADSMMSASSNAPASVDARKRELQAKIAQLRWGGG